MSEDLGVKVMQLQALLYYGGYYDGALGNNRTNMSATLSAITNARLGYSLEQMSNFSAPMLDDALGKMKNKFESSPRMQYALVRDIDAHMKSDKRNEIHVMSGRALQGLGYHIKDRHDYGEAVNDFKAKHRPPVRVVDLTDSFNDKANPDRPKKPITDIDLSKTFKAAAASVQPAPEVPDVSEEPDVPPPESEQEGSVNLVGVPSVPVMPEMKDTLRMVAGVSDVAARKGVLDVAPKGDLLLICKVGEGERASIAAHNVTNHLREVPGLHEVPFSQKVFGGMAGELGAARKIEGFNPEAGIVRTQHANGETQTKYDIWAHLDEVEKRIKVNVVTPELEQSNGTLIAEAREQTRSLYQSMQVSAPAQTFNMSVVV